MRFIARLDVKGDRLVKGIQFDGLRSFGPPDRYAKYYEGEGADELLFLDAVASLYGRNSLLDMIARVSREVFIPLTVGGGLRSLNDIEKVLSAGADKVAINTAAIAHPDLIADAAARFGSSTIVVSIEAKRMPDGSFQAFVDNGREPSGRDVFMWAREAQECGAGEILVTSVDRDGTGDGFDVPLIKGVADVVKIPVIVSGGAGRTAHLDELMRHVRIEGIALGSLLHYEAARHIAGSTTPSHVRIEPARITDIKASVGGGSRIGSVGQSGHVVSEEGAVVGIVSSGTGNLASVRYAAEAAGLTPRDVLTLADLDTVDGLILPGVGAFGEGVRALRRAHLDRAIIEWAEANKPLMGICLGMQLMFSESDEFGASKGLGIFEGRVRAMRPRIGATAKSPHIGWNNISRARSWDHSILVSQSDQAAMYFMHSYFVEPSDHKLILSATWHGDLEFCSAIQRGNVFGCQFHPERSGPAGLDIYRQFARNVCHHKANEGMDVHAMCHN